MPNVKRSVAFLLLVMPFSLSECLRLFCVGYRSDRIQVDLEFPLCSSFCAVSEVAYMQIIEQLTGYTVLAVGLCGLSSSVLDVVA